MISLIVLVCLWTTVMQSRDPSTNVVLLEDAAAVLGVMLAAGCMGLTSLTGKNELNSFDVRKVSSYPTPPFHANCHSLHLSVLCKSTSLYAPLCYHKVNMYGCLEASSSCPVVFMALWEICLKIWKILYSVTSFHAWEQPWWQFQLSLLSGALLQLYVIEV